MPCKLEDIDSLKATIIISFDRKKKPESLPVMEVRVVQRGEMSAGVI